MPDMPPPPQGRVASPLEAVLTLVGIPSLGLSPYLPALLSELARLRDVPVLLLCNGSGEDYRAVHHRIDEAERLPRHLAPVGWHPTRGIYGLWNVIIERAAADGHRAAVILNDDVFVDAWSVKAAALAIDRDGYAIVGWDPDADPARRPSARVVADVHGTYREHGVTGFAFALDAAAGVRCDERFGWWGGDDDLVYTVTARSLRAGKMVGVGVRHWPSTSSQQRLDVLGSLEADRALLLAKWGRTWG